MKPNAASLAIDYSALFGRLFVDSPLPSQNTATHWLYASTPSIKTFTSNDTTGKWCIFRSKPDIDKAWKKISTACASGKLAVAKCSTAASRGFASHVICVYTNNFNDTSDVMNVREVLRKLGFTEELGYKRDLDTIRGVYNCPEEWMLCI